MKKIIILFSGILFYSCTQAQHIHHPPPPPPPPSPHDLIVSPPVYDPETHEEIIRDINEIREHFDEIKNPNAGIIETNDTVNRSVINAFPTLYLYTKVTYPDKPKNNHSNQTYIKDFCIASKFSAEDGNDNRYTDQRTLINYKTCSIIYLHEDKSGKRKGSEIEFRTLNLAPDGTLKMLNTDSSNGSGSIQETAEYKTISGYNCRKYVKSDVTGLTEIWTTGDIKYDPQLADAMLKAFYNTLTSIPNTFNDYKQVLKGIPVQLVYIPKGKNQLKCVITYEKIESGISDPAVFNTGGYTVQPLRTLQEIYNSRD